ncbi:hypothetical protein HK104_004158, partial [Borealophlyctis nickersoniae]
MEGPPNITIRHTSLPPLPDIPPDTPPSTIEKTIMQSTGVQDMARIREMLKQSRGDADRVVEALWEEIQAETGP